MVGREVRRTVVTPGQRQVVAFLVVVVHAGQHRHLRDVVGVGGARVVLLVVDAVHVVPLVVIDDQPLGVEVEAVEARFRTRETAHHVEIVARLGGAGVGHGVFGRERARVVLGAVALAKR